MSKAADMPGSVMEDAIGWFDDLRHATPVDNEAFTTWLMRSPTHVEAFLTIAALHGGLAAASASNRVWLESLVAEAQSNVVPLDGGCDNLRPPVSSVLRQAHRAWPRPALVALVLLTVLAGLVIGIWPIGGSDGVAHYATAVGEQRTLVLDDGSLLQLNTNTTVTVRYSSGAREIVLLSGEALFNVRKDPARPFRVQSGQVWVEAIGTRFNVYRKVEETRVTVIEGRVAVDSPGARASGRTAAGPGGQTSDRGHAGTDDTINTAVELAAGEQLAIRRDGTIAEQTVAVDTQRTIAWMQRRVAFDNDTLAKVASELNRYNRDQLIIDDETLRQRRISGVFTVSDPQSFAEVLASMTPIQFEKRADGSVRIVRAESAAEPLER
jgi:transmembrane sensor